MDKTTYINYYQKSVIEIDKIKRAGIRPKIALHVCCGPCSTFPLEFLNPFFRITILYTNSNIYPEEEYVRRRDELKKYVSVFNQENNADVEIIEFDYDNEKFNARLVPYASCKEGGERCRLCYTLRMEEAYTYADNHNYDYFCTIMTISRQKNSQVLNQIGAQLQKNHKTKYFFSDFKKKKGIDRSVELRKKYNLYNQLYCGCIYSYNNYLLKINKQEEK